MKVRNIRKEATLDNDMLSFLSLAQQLLSFLQHENAIFLDRGKLSYEGFLKRKQSLLADFELMASHLIRSLSMKEGQNNLLTAIVQDQLDSVKEAVKINTSLHTQSINVQAVHDRKDAVCH
ncbi:MAG: hypothetical protein GC136_01995 [Alphaproteobacteria bacterium]|nr:hypothetical protein [Alphaproteobacteria bacterium]